MASQAATHASGDHHNPDNAQAHTHEHGGPKQYAMVLGALLFLTAVTVVVAMFPTESQALNLVIAMTIATIKASLVGAIFMHLRYDRPVNAIILVTSFFLVGLLIWFSLMDLDYRPVIMPGSYKAPQGIVTEEFAKAKQGSHGGEHGEAHGGAEHNPPTSDGVTRPDGGRGGTDPSKTVTGQSTTTESETGGTAQPGQKPGAPSTAQPAPARPH